MLPGILYTFIFGYATLPYLLIAFEDFDYQKGLFSPWVGLENFRFFFESNRAWEVTRNTLLLNVFFLFFGTAAAVGLALLLNEVRSRGFARATQSTMLFPYFISWVIVSYILYALLSTDKGVVNNLLDSVGLPRVNGDFGMVYALVKDSGQLLTKVDVIDTYVFRMLRVTGDPSLSMAVGLYQSVMGFVMVYGSNRLVKNCSPTGRCSELGKESQNQWRSKNV